MGALSDAGIRPSVRPSISCVYLKTVRFMAMVILIGNRMLEVIPTVSVVVRQPEKNRNNTALAGVPHGHIFNNVS